MSVIVEPGRTFLDNSGRVLNAGTVTFYVAGSTVTKKAIYPTAADQAAGTNALSNPQTLNSAGRLPQQVHGSNSYRMIVKDSLGATILDEDIIVTTDYTGLTAATVGAILYPRTAAEISAGVTPTDYTYPEGYVARYGASGAASAGTNATAIQNAFNISQVVTFDKGVTYSVGTTTISFTKHNQIVYGNSSTISYTGTTYAIDFTPISNTYLQGVQVNELFVTASGVGAVGWRIRCSYGNFINCSSNISATTGAGAAWLLYTDITYGSGPYYNHFDNCLAAGSPSSTTNFGWKAYLDAAQPSRGPNANQWLGGRTSTFNTAWLIAGAGNNLFGVVVEGTKSGGYVFDFTNANLSGINAGSFNNCIFGAYVEGSSGANFCRFGAYTSQCRVVYPYVTSLGAGTYLTDSSSNVTNQILDERGYTFQNSGATPYNTLDYYDENGNQGASNGWTPSVAGSSTAGTQTYSARVARYTRIGDMCHVTATCVMTAKDGATAGNIRITGLPFTVRGVTNAFGNMAIGGIKATNTASYTGFCARAVPGTTYIELIEVGSAQTPIALAATNIGATFEIEVSGWYEI